MSSESLPHPHTRFLNRFEKSVRDMVEETIDARTRGIITPEFAASIRNELLAGAEALRSHDANEETSGTTRCVVCSGAGHLRNNDRCANCGGTGRRPA